MSADYRETCPACESTNIEWCDTCAGPEAVEYRVCLDCGYDESEGHDPVIERRPGAVKRREG